MNHEKFYSNAFFYDIAFRFKEVKKENQTLLDVYIEINKRMPESFVDLAAGPAANAIDMSKRGLRSFAIDQSRDMVEYGRRKIRESETDTIYLQEDIRYFALPQPVDLSAIFMASTGYLLTHEDMIQHLICVANNLNPKGIYVLEMLHPRDVFSPGSSTSSQWENMDEGVKVSVQWGDENDRFNPITQIKKVTAHLKYQTPTESGEIIDSCEQREYTFQEMKALIDLSKVFELKKTLGSWDNATPFSNEETAWRMILILQKKAGKIN